MGAIELHALGVANRLAGLNAEHDVLRVGVVFTEIVAVVGGDERKAEIFFELEEAGMNLVLLGETLILNFKIEIFLTENIAKSSGSGAGGFVVPFHEPLGDFSF